LHCRFRLSLCAYEPSLPPVTIACCPDWKYLSIHFVGTFRPFISTNSLSSITAQTLSLDLTCVQAKIQELADSMSLENVITVLLISSVLSRFLLAELQSINRIQRKLLFKGAKRHKIFSYSTLFTKLTTFSNFLRIKKRRAALHALTKIFFVFFAPSW
jgi:hypothetical protein